MNNVIMEVNDLKVHFNIKNENAWPWEKGRPLKAVDGISLKIYEGETLGVVGESGCGKSTFARALLRLLPITEGNVVWLGQDLVSLDKQQMRDKRQELQMIFQDPLASLNPRMTVGNIIAEPLRTFKPELCEGQVKEKVRRIMDRVGLLPNVINRYPHEFSGGQCQRIGIARALILEPKLVVCDEPVSALDVSIQAQVVNLLKELQQEMGLALVFIAHDLSVVKHISDRVLVMYLGNAVELADKHSLYDSPQHPYTKALLSAVPVPDPEIERNKTIQLLAGDLPSPISPPSGCVFRTRCPHANERCVVTRPQLQPITSSHQASCLRLGELIDG
ncbi:murein tripeptide/oligopeptide ABC transporter ATP binding protein OppF [Marinomonas sp. 2405UD68-3]|uniref:murein tripeptide/oligopeptide ABC transporter ATP binding protein OppF n=1 Tax=Marinomonas sp. 2405UD68-3 TaxID=3391835 RepID=UPI0039C9A989